MAPKSQTPATDVRNRVFSEMNKPTQDVAKRIDKRFKEIAKGTLERVWDIGADAKSMLEDESTHGSKSLRQVAEYVGHSTQMLHYYKKITETFDRDHLSQLAAEPLANGDRLTVTHLIHLSNLPKKSHRNKMLARTYSEGLSAQQLAKEISAQDMTTKSGGGRKPAKPTSPISGAQQMDKTLKGLLRRFDEAWKESVFDRIDVESSDKVGNPDLLNKLQAVEDDMETLRDYLEQYIPRLKANQERIQKIIDQTAEGVQSSSNGENQSGEKANGRARKNLSSKERGKQNTGARGTK
jgi:hypothetical protein